MTLSFKHPNLPFGELFVSQMAGSFDSRYKFTGKERDEETGYDYFGARYYDSDLSQWLSVDPMSDKRPNLSPYNYCQWNPIGRTDPDGALDWIPPTDESGNWIAEKGDNAWTLHKDAGMSYDRAKSLMKSQGFNFSNNDTHVDVQAGDVVNVNGGYTWNTGTSSSPSTPSATPNASGSSVDANQVAETANTAATGIGLVTDATREIVKNPTIGYNIAYNNALLKGVSYLKPLSYLASGMSFFSDVYLSSTGKQSWTETGMNTAVTGVSIAVGGWPGLVIQVNYLAGKSYIKTIIKHPEWTPYPVRGFNH